MSASDSGSKVTFPSIDGYLYREVYLITEYKQGKVFKTRSIGFCRADRPQKPDELYASLSTKLLKQETITLELLS